MKLLSAFIALICEAESCPLHNVPPDNDNDQKQQSIFVKNLAEYKMKQYRSKVELRSQKKFCGEENLPVRFFFLSS